MNQENQIPGLTIRAVTQQDIPLLYDLICEMAHFEKLSDEVTATPEKLLHSLVQNPRGAEAYLAYVEQTVMGYVVIAQNYSTFVGDYGLYLEDIYVCEQFRGRGYGKQLLEFVMRLASDRGCERLDWVVLAWNQRAIDFYQKLGAELLEDWRLCRFDVKKIQNP